MLRSKWARYFGIGIVARRCCLILGVALFLGLYNWLYINWLAPTFGYLGMSYHEPAPHLLEMAWVLALLPSLWLPLELKRTSQVPFWVIYIMVYIPSMFGPMYMALQSRHDITVLMFCMFAGFVIISIAYLIPPARLTQRLVSPSFFWRAIYIVTAALDLWVIAIFHSHMRLVGFNEVYDLRSASEEVAAGSAVGYGMMLLSSVINPLYMSYGLLTKRKGLLAFGFLNQVLLYSVGGSKAVVLSVVMLVGLYVLMGRTGRDFGIKLVGAIAAVLVLLCFAATRKDLNPVFSFAMSLLFMRTFANGGYTTGAYSNFFHAHPLTYLSNVHGLGAFIHYPYHSALGLELGFYEMGISDLDLNAHFWASDGIAGFGPFGIVLISALCALVFWVLDCSTARHNVVFASLMIAFITLNLTNVSLFTTLVSGGLGLLILLFLAMPQEGATASTLSQTNASN